MYRFGAGATLRISRFVGEIGVVLMLPGALATRKRFTFGLIQQQERRIRGTALGRQGDRAGSETWRAVRQMLGARQQLENFVGHAVRLFLSLLIAALAPVDVPARHRA